LRPDKISQLTSSVAISTLALIRASRCDSLCKNVMRVFSLPSAADALRADGEVVEVPPR
jgi:hypothetical protein